MRNAGKILAVTLVAMALCADRAVAAVPGSWPLRPNITQVTRQVVSQLTRRFRQTVPATRIAELHHDSLNCPALTNLSPNTPLGLHLSQSTPFQFRLPPPAC